MYDNKWFTFDQLSLEQLYAVLRLRQDVFIVEQRCIFPDVDGLDKNAWHLLVYESASSRLAAYLRILFSHERHAIRDANYFLHDDSMPSIGRIVVSKDHRGHGLGRKIIELALNHAEQIYGDSAIHLAAQTHLVKFYESFGFVQVSEPFDEEGIMHIDMVKSYN